MRRFACLLVLVAGGCRGSGQENLGLSGAGTAVAVAQLTHVDELVRALAPSGRELPACVRLRRRGGRAEEAGPRWGAGPGGGKRPGSARSRPDAAPAESEAGKKWRNTLQARYLDGDVVLDQKTGAPLSVRLEAAYGF